MEIYNVVIVYTDGESITVSVPKDRIDMFMACMKEGKVYQDERNGANVFIPIENVRYSHFVRAAHPQEVPVAEQQMENLPVLDENKEEAEASQDD